MALIVQKFGGTSMATADIIKQTSTLVEKERALGNQVVVVVSAMAGVTDQLVSYVKDMTVAPHPREYDTVVSAGEQIAAGLMALALRSRMIPAKSWLGWQVPIETSPDHTYSKIEEISLQRIQASLAWGEVPIIAGFQGMTNDFSITTFGRGGSDLTAVALAAALKADRCDLYKDVPGVMTADPKIVQAARWIPVLSYEEMINLSSLGSKILQDRAIRLAAKFKVPLRICPTFSKGQGTRIVAKEEIMENQKISSIVCNYQEALIRLKGVTQPEQLFKTFSRFNIIIDMVFLSPDLEILFTVSRQDAERALSLGKTALKSDVFEGSLETNYAKVSLVGLGLRSQPDLIAQVFYCLKEKGIEVKCFSTSELKICILVDEVYAELATRLLHKHFELDRDNTHEHTTFVPAKAVAGGL
jgi:aspartate kinase